TVSSQMIENGFNPFYGIMPQWFLYFGIAIATTATIIASQALISGSFTLVSEAIRLNLWPKLKINYPSEARGQLYVPGVNMLLFSGCIGMVLYFRKASNMEAAYGLAITVTMIATSILFANYLVIRRIKPILIYTYLALYLTIEGSFLYANIDKFPHGGFVTLIVGGFLFFVMYDWYKARKIKNRYTEFVRLEHYLNRIQELSHDLTVPKYASQLVFLTSSDNPKEIEHKIIYSILSNRPKRAEVYWFIHVDTMDDPYSAEYMVNYIVPNNIIRVELRLGFKMQPRIHVMFRQIVETLAQNKEVNIKEGYKLLGKGSGGTDFQFIVMEKFLSQDNELPLWERLILKFYFWIKEISLSEERGFGLDRSHVVVEKFPLIVSPISNIRLKRTEPNE
ncbi:MAG TPA: KUP/HAK/KT family potassium transporter, partial [Ferruginibacter sp.]|nr:KUP/HAK/KT family potassium transporter [Ferruginibacter sp.]